FLDEEQLIKRFDGSDASWSNLEPSDFVEIRGVFRPNAFSHWLNTVNRIITMILPIYKYEITTLESKKTAVKGDKVAQTELDQQINQSKNQIREFEYLSEILGTFTSDLEQENTRLFIVDLHGTQDYKGVIALSLEFLRDKSTWEISHKEFRLLGKVVRRLDKGTEEQIDLLSGTGFGGFGEQILSELFANFHSIDQKTIKVPELVTSIPAPALQIVPLAVYI